MNQVFWNPFKEDYKEDPVGYMDKMRINDPVHKGFNDNWVLTRYADVRFVLSNPDFKAYDLPNRIGHHALHSHEDSNELKRLASAMSNWILYQDPPLHTAHKSAIFKIWKQLEIEDFVDQTTFKLLTALADKKEVELIDEFAVPLPVRVINKMIGVADLDSEVIRDWSLVLTSTQEPFAGISDFEKAEQITRSSSEYFRNQIARLKALPKQDNYLSCWIHEHDSSEEELISTLHLLFIAGIETTITIFGNIVAFLIDNPEVLTEIKRHPSKISQAAEEILRLNNSARYVARIATKDIEIGGKVIKKDQTVYLCLFSANHDPSVFPNPGQFDLHREKNPHLSFGYGAHHCLGSQLSKLEILKFLQYVIKMDINFESNGPRIIDHKSIIFRRVLELPVRIV